MKKIVLTGAAGRLGSYLREPLSKLCDEFVSSDLVDNLNNLQHNETYVQADITDLEAMVSLLDGADMVVHFGAVGDEAPMDVLWGRIFTALILSGKRLTVISFAVWFTPLLYMRSACIKKQISLALMHHINLIRFTVWPNVLQKILQAFIGINADWSLFACVSCLVRSQQIRVP